MKPNAVLPTIEGSHYAYPCQCEHRTCKNWHIYNVADVQGVAFTKEQAIDVADFLNARESAMSQPIRLWPFKDAPTALRELSTHGGNEDWVAEIPRGLSNDLPQWFAEFLGPMRSEHVHPHKPTWRVFIWARA